MNLRSAIYYGTAFLLLLFQTSSSNIQLKEVYGKRGSVNEEDLWKFLPGAEDATTKIEPYIIGGSVADASRYPYFGLVLTFDASDDFLALCGSSLFHPDMALTSAAACGGPDVASMFFVSGDIEIPFNGQEELVFVRKWWTPTEYSDDSSDYNFLLIQLSSPLSKELVILNPSDSIPVVGDDVTVMGFGRRASNESFSSDLIEVDIKVRNNNKCREYYLFTYKSERMICAYNSKKGGCYSDFGSPLIIRGSGPSSDTQVGLLSFFPSAGCKDILPDAPEAYSRVSWWYDTIAFYVCTESEYPSSSISCSDGSPQTKPPTRSPSHSPTRSPTPEPPTPSSGDGVCLDNPINWVDSFGDGCDWYAQDTNCEDYGTIFENKGKTAIEACCICGGGTTQQQKVLPSTSSPTSNPTPGPTSNPTSDPTVSPTSNPTSNPTSKPTTSKPTATPTAAPTEEDVCVDKPVGWIDSLGRDCEWYSKSKERCPKFGTNSKFEYLGYTAVEACCVCGGGALLSTVLPPLSWEGLNGCSSSAPCNECVGECENDTQCAGNLRCFLRTGTEPVPGCEGAGISQAGYCFRLSSDFASTPRLTWLGWDGCKETRQCGLCEGDCDSDDECQGSLVCSKSNSPTLPGCRGAKADGGDYCF